jgi:hypothetical protein
MAEKTSWANCLIVHLTYSDETKQGYEGARMFCYQDVRLFAARVRAAIRAYDRAEAKRNRVKVKYQRTIKFICAGEQGSENGRCHWHLIVYSDMDLLKLGKMHGRFGEVSEREKMISVGSKKIRLNWSLWPLGFALFQEPDQGGMRYVLSYCLKDQFTVEKSQDTARHHKAENFATGLFRMSKRQPIGYDFITKKIHKLHQMGAVMPKLEFKVPGLTGYWRPNGAIRDRLVYSMQALNALHVRDHGRNAPQWSSLLAYLASSDHDMEIINGTQAQDIKSADAILNSNVGPSEAEEIRHTVSRCFGVTACYSCLAKKTDDQFRALGCQVEYSEDDFGTTVRKVSYTPREWDQKPYPFCQQPDGQLQARAAEYLARQTRGANV